MKNSLWFIAAFVAVVTATTAIVSATRRPVFVTSLAFTINRSEAQATTDYQYDGYYAVQAEDLLSQTLLSWFLTPSTVLSFYERAGIETDVTSVGQLTARFRARKLSAQVITAQFTVPERETASKLATAIGAIVSERAGTLNVTESGAIYSVTADNPIIVETKANEPLNTAVAAIASLLFAFVVVLATRYLRSDGHAHRV